MFLIGLDLALRSIAATPADVENPRSALYADRSLFPFCTEKRTEPNEVFSWHGWILCS